MGAPSVLVLGGSVTAGGGVGNNPTRAWHAFLGDVKTKVHYKNAIDPSYFLHCTERFVNSAAAPHAVLLDLGPNLFGSGAADTLVALIRRLRCLYQPSYRTPSIAFLNWPGVPSTNASLVATRRTGAALLAVPHGPELYSTDGVHPNARGHALIAFRVREYLNRLPGRATIPPPEDCAIVESEACFPSAADMPVVRDTQGEPRDWALVDDSPTPELVHKYGWASSTPGANLTLVIPQDDECGAVVTLAFLSSNQTGPFRMTCAPGCACTKIHMFHQWRAFPFPVATGQEEWMGVCKDCDRLKVTRETAFNLLRQRPEPCRVTVTVLTERRVRLDGLYVQVPSEEYLRHVRKSPYATPAQRWFRANALRTQCELGAR